MLHKRLKAKGQRQKDKTAGMPGGWKAGRPGGWEVEKLGCCRQPQYRPPQTLCPTPCIQYFELSALSFYRLAFRFFPMSNELLAMSLSLLPPSFPALHLTPYTSHLTPCAARRVPCALCPAPCAVHRAPCAEILAPICFIPQLVTPHFPTSPLPNLLPCYPPTRLPSARNTTQRPTAPRPLK